MHKPEHVMTKEVEFDGKEYLSADIVILRSLLRRKFHKLLQQLDQEKNRSSVQTIQEARKLFINDYLHDIALYIAQCSESGNGATSEQIAEHLEIKEIKYVHNKLPFIRKILELIGLRLVSVFVDSSEESEKENSLTMSTKMKIPSHKIEKA